MGRVDVFDTADDLQIFVGVVTDTQWREFCEMFELSDLAADRTLETNSQRVAGRDRVIPRLRALFKGLTRAEAASACERANLPFAPITRPDELFDDPQLKAPGAMVEVSLPGGGTTFLPALPLNSTGSAWSVASMSRVPVNTALPSPRKSGLSGRKLTPCSATALLERLRANSPAVGPGLAAHCYLTHNSLGS